jgi:RNA polymerase sigma-70 factor, ECF subfamily
MPQTVGDRPSSPLPDDSALVALVERARAGDGPAFATLFERYQTPIFRYLERLVSSPDIGRDLTQDTFLAAWRALPGLREAQLFTPWLYRIATNMARAHLRHSRLIRWLPWAETETTNGPHLMLVDPEEQVGQAEWVRLALAELPPRFRICLLLQVEGGFSLREIAQLLGMKEKSVSSALCRGRQQFRAAYLRLEHELAASERRQRGHGV